MSDNNDEPAVGSVLWRDLTVPDAESLQKFYQKVVGWKADPVSMGDYNDYSMLAANGDCVGGVCHARGNNEGIPGQWLIYVKVADLDKSIEASTALGGKIVHGPRNMGENRFCVIQDPTGAVIGLIS